MFPDPTALPPRQAAALGFIQGYQREHGSMPTVRELADGLGLASPRAAAELIEKLILAGALYKLPGIHRGLRLSEFVAAKAASALQLPLLGRIAAGKPLMFSDHIEDESQRQLCIADLYLVLDEVS